MVEVPERLGTVYEDSKDFNKDVFGSIFKRKKHLEAWITGVNRRMEVVDSSSRIWLERELQEEYS